MVPFFGPPCMYIVNLLYLLLITPTCN